MRQPIAYMPRLHWTSPVYIRPSCLGSTRIPNTARATSRYHGSGKFAVAGSYGTVKDACAVAMEVLTPFTEAAGTYMRASFCRFPLPCGTAI